MEEIASISGVSIQTIYNQFGSKSSLLFHILNEIVSTVDTGIEERASEDPIDAFLNSIDSVSSIYLSNPTLHGALLRHLFGIKDELNRPRFMEMSVAFWHHALDAVFARWPERDILKTELAQDMLYLTSGALETWAQGDIDDRQFRAALRRGGALRLLALDLPGTRGCLLREVAESRQG
jgi:AcrR family transcriptional regulator